MHWTYFIQQLQKMRQLEADLETAEDDHLRDELDHKHADAEQRLEQLQRQLSDLATREQRGELSDSELMDLLELETKVEAAESAVRSAKVACNSHKRSTGNSRPQRRKQYFAIRHELFGEEIPTT
jgi:chromosome segregation ATPase